VTSHHEGAAEKVISKDPGLCAGEDEALGDDMCSQFEISNMPSFLLVYHCR
jgi:hypothetical protein